MTPTPTDPAATVANAEEVSEEIRWLIIWPNGDIYASHAVEDDANFGLDDLIVTLVAYGVPREYFPTVKRRRRTITRSAWEDLPSV